MARQKPEVNMIPFAVLPAQASQKLRGRCVQRVESQKDARLSSELQDLIISLACESDVRELHHRHTLSGSGFASIPECLWSCQRKPDRLL